MPQSLIEIKGSNFTLAVIHLYTSRSEIIHEALIKKNIQNPIFLKNAPVVVNISKVYESVNWKKLQHTITEAGLHVIGVSGCKDEKLKTDITNCGLPLLSEGKVINENYFITSQKQYMPVKTRIINTPIRSGQQIYARDSDLIIISSVSEGAEVISDGNIHIYGILRGRALAGASGDVSSQIFCANLAAELVSIAGYYWISNQIPKSFYGQSARFNLNDNALTVESLF
ncbi:septum site-determining protein MinC [Candidatus Profftia sp. (ex Adelges kitamiensis)]|uniref:septum site-determining protein MinC n=1 Tax=Candidatus Profftia sp. (ex Adelges kitamiensis) TaxID=2864218 RepID=UPI001CE26C45|nr:septum site-determining protein MinC [Candidatus Profftia sp. (ex Adelges kitamiensis)]